MRVLGLTGGMGAGKSTVARLLRRAGWPVFDADAEVHRMQRRGGAAVAAIARVWPDTVLDGTVDRVALRKRVIGHPENMRALEDIVHPLVSRARERFLRRCRRRYVRWCVLDIPLLFEVGADGECDIVMVVTAPEALRVQRVMRRRSLTREQAQALIKRQMPDAERLRRADIVVRTGLSKGKTCAQVCRLRKRLEAMP